MAVTDRCLRDRKFHPIALIKNINRQQRSIWHFSAIILCNRHFSFAFLISLSSLRKKKSFHYNLDLSKCETNSAWDKNNIDEGTVTGQGFTEGFELFSERLKFTFGIILTGLCKIKAEISQKVINYFNWILKSNIFLKFENLTEFKKFTKFVTIKLNNFWFP